MTIDCPLDETVATFDDIVDVFDAALVYDGDGNIDGPSNFCVPGSVDELDENMYGDGTSFDVTCSVFDPESVPISDIANPSCTYTFSISAPGELQP